MEEDIKILEEFIKSIKNFNNYADNTNVSLITKKQVQAIKNLIARNKDLEKLVEGVEKIRDLTIPAKTDFIIVMRENYLPHLREDVILKSKIKEKIEEIDVRIGIACENYDKSVDEERTYWKKEKHDAIMQRFILQELIED